MRLFGKESPVGKNIYFDGKMLTVSGVIEQPVCKTTFNFDALVSKKLRQGISFISCRSIEFCQSLFFRYAETKKNIRCKESFRSVR